MPPEHFGAIIDACDVATQPANLPYPAPDWWRGLLVTAYMTGWRIGETLELWRADVDLTACTAKLRAEATKGKRDDVVKLHDVVIDELRGLASFHKQMFPWSKSRKTLYTQFHRIQIAAGIHLPCSRDHNHTPSCHMYGFHDERRAFATLNAGQMSGDALQKLMRHKSYTTTQKYINMSKQVNDAVDSLFVPDALRRRK